MQILLWAIYLFLILWGLFTLTSILRGLLHSTTTINPTNPIDFGDGVQYVGHGSVLIQMDGKKILTDPILTNTISFSTKRFVSLGLPFSVISQVDLVIISHPHVDHFNSRSLKKFDRNVMILIPKGLEKKVKGWGFKNVHTMIPGAEIDLFNLHISGVPAQHNTAKGALGYVIEGSWSVYFAGDTAYNPDYMDSIGQEFSIDVALLPIGCYLGYINRHLQFSLGAIHMSPREVVSAQEKLKATTIIPIHWGTFIIGTEPIHWAKQEMLHVIEQNPTLPVKIVNHGKFWKFTKKRADL